MATNIAADSPVVMNLAWNACEQGIFFCSIPPRRSSGPPRSPEPGLGPPTLEVEVAQKLMGAREFGIGN